MHNVVLKCAFATILSFILSVLYLYYPLQYFIGFIAILLLLSILIFRPLAGIYLIITILTLRSFVSGPKLSFSSTTNFDPGGIINVFITIGILLYLVINRKNPTNSKSLIVYIIFMLVSFASCFYTNDYFVSIKYLIRMLTPFMFYTLCIYEIYNMKCINKILNYVIGISWIPLIIGIIELVMKFSPEYRVKSVFGHPNPFSFYLLLVFIIAYSEHLNSSNTKRKLYLGLYCVIATLLLIFTYCRITWLAFMLSFTLISVLYRKYIYIINGIIIVSIIAAINYSAFYDRIKETILYFQAGNTFDLNTSIGWRFKTWDTILQGIYHRPFLGYGLRSHLSLIESLFGWQTSVHNSYLEILYDTGILGFSIFTVFLITIYLSIMKIRKIYHSVDIKLVNQYKYYYTMSIAAFISYCIIMTSDNILEYYDIGVYYWLIFAIAQILVYKKGFVYNEAST